MRSLLLRRRMMSKPDLPEPFDARSSYLTFEAVYDATNVWFARYSNKAQITKRTIYYSLDGGNTWVSYTAANSVSSSTVMVTVNAGQKIMVKGTNSLYSNTASDDYHLCFRFSKSTYVYGNILSLCYGDSFSEETDLRSSHAFKGLFRSAAYMLAHPNKDLLLPSLTVTAHSYKLLFSGCSRLTRIVCLATSISATDATVNMTDGVAASGTFYKSNGMTSWTTGVNGIPAGWSVEDYIEN